MKKTNIGIQLIRVFSMIFIVFYHCLCYYGVWGGVFATNVKYSNIESWKSACYLALSAFVFISGYLYGIIYKSGKYRNTSEFLKNKASRLLIPYLLVGMLLIIIFPAIYDIYSLIHGISHLWFLLMMVLIFLIAILIKDRILQTPLLIFLIIFTTITNAVVAKFLPQVPSYFVWKSALYYLPFFLFGILCEICDLPTRLNQWNKWAFYSVFAVFSIIIISSIVKFSWPWGLLYFGFIEAFWFLLVYTVLTFKIPKVASNSVIEKLDKHSMGIYIIHHILIWVVLLYIPPVTPFMNEHYIIAPMILFTVVFVVSLLLSGFMHKFKYTRRILGSK